MNQKAIYLLFIISLLSIGNAGIIREEGQVSFSILML